jgi:hypothetical protein
MPERIYENDDYIITPDTNADDAAGLSFAIAGSGLPLMFSDNVDGSFTMSTTIAGSLDFPAYYTVTVTDGCTVATETFMYSEVREKAALVTVVNLGDSTMDLFFSTTPEDATEMTHQKATSILARSADNQMHVVKVGTYDLSAYSRSFSNDTPEEYDVEDLFGTLSGITFELDKSYLVVVYMDELGDYQLMNTMLDMPEADESFSLTVSHFAGGVGPVNLINADTGDPLITGLEFGSTSDALELSINAAYNVGLDIDNDNMIDAYLPPLPAGTFDAGVSVNVGAFLNDVDLQFSVYEYLMGEGGFGTLAPYVPPMQIQELIDNLPYALNGYENNEDAELGDPSTREFLAPEGTTSITIMIDYSTEPSWDDLIVKDIEGNEVFNGNGTGVDVTIVIPGSYFSIGVDSDFSGTYDGYTITSVVFE